MVPWHVTKATCGFGRSDRQELLSTLMQIGSWLDAQLQEGDTYQHKKEQPEQVNSETHTHRTCRHRPSHANSFQQCQPAPPIDAVINIKSILLAREKWVFHLIISLSEPHSAGCYHQKAFLLHPLFTFNYPFRWSLYQLHLDKMWASNLIWFGFPLTYLFMPTAQDEKTLSNNNSHGNYWHF